MKSEDALQVPIEQVSHQLESSIVQSSAQAISSQQAIGN
jgi:hypothetical protein